MKKNILSLVFIALSSLLISQNVSHECGNHKIDSLRKSSDIAYTSKVLQLNNVINDFINTNYKNNNSTQSVMAISPNAQYVIPVVVHIVLDPSNPINNTTVSYPQVQSQIDALNLAFAKGYPTGPSAVDTKIQFCLAQLPMGIANWPNTSEPGVIRYNDAVNSQNQVSINSTNNLINLTNSSGRFPFGNYLNIWVVNSIDGPCSGVQGYAINPLGPQYGQNGFAIDGVVIRADAFGDNSTGNTFVLQPHNLYGSGCPTSFAQRNEGKVLVHEVGHYLNLWHTFQNDIVTGATCTGNTAGTCNTQGDFCCDTPPSNVISTHICGSSNPNSCGVPDMIENYMFYAFDPCWNTFTQDQTNRMWAYLNMFRSDLFSIDNQVATGLIGTNGCLGVKLLADFNTSPNSLCSGTAITFQPILGPANSATSWNWTFPGGSITSSILQNPIVTFPNPGTYLVSLTVNDGINPAVTNSQNIIITPCVLNPNYVNNAQWFFGQYASINFSSGTPVPSNVARVNQTVFGMECGYSYADNTGNLVFYTDGINLWDASHAQINTSPVFPTSAFTGNSFTWMNQSSTSSYGLMGVPFPNNPNKYYIFCAPSTSDIGTFDNVRYVVLDLAANTISSAQNLSQTVPMCEGLTIIPHCNGVDYWLVTHARYGASPTNNRFYSYLISSLGLNNNPIISANNNYNAYSIVSIKASPDNQRIVIAGGFAGNPSTSDIGLYDFNNSTGVINNEQIFDVPLYSQFVGCSFSSNSQEIYSSSMGNNVIVQFDLSGNSTVIGTNLVSPVYLQLGPDNNIYIGNNGFGSVTSMGSILNPNTPNNTGSFLANAVDFSTITPADITTKQGLPNLMDGIKPPATNPTFTSVYTSCSNVDFTMNSCWGGYVYNWNFGDGTPVVTGLSVSHNYTTPGAYNVICTLTIPGLSGNIVTQPQTINIINPVVVITGTNNVCQNNNTPYIYNVPFVNGATYNWSISSNGTILGASSGSQINVQWNSGTVGTISVVITKDGCTSNGTLNVAINPLPTITAVASPPTVCLTSPNSVLTAAGGTSYVWNTGATTNPITVSPLNTTAYSVIGTNSNGCSNSANVTVTYINCVPNCGSCSPFGTSGLITSNPTANNVYCISNDVTISGTRIFVNTEFKMSTGVKIIVPTGANLIISHSHFYACTDMWQGIIVQNGGKLSILNNSLIEDAEIAVDITNNTQTSIVFNLNNSTFNKNYKSIYIEKYNQPIPNYPFIIKGCVFTSRDIPFSSLNWPNTSAIKATAANAGAPLSSDIIDNALYSSTNTNSLLKAPHNTQKSQIGIDLVNVGLTQGTEASPIFYEFTLGAIGNINTNVFDNIRFEVNMFNSSLNSINNIYQNTSLAGKSNGGRGINASCDKNFNGRLKVTKVNSAINKFIDCGSAIQTVDYFVHEITDNEIRSSKVINPFSAPLNFIGVNGVYISTNRYYNCTVNNNGIYNIENGIVFTVTNGSYSIYGTSDVGQYAKELNIKTNTISANFIGSAITTQYTKNAIVVQNVLFNGVGFAYRAPYTITVSNNQISKVYRGIMISNFGKIFQQMNSNMIDLTQDVFVTNNKEFGIGLFNNRAYQNHTYNNFSNNTITGYGISNPNNSGILFETSTGTTLGCNTVDNTTNGLHFNGFSGDNAIYKNIMQNNNYGFVLNNNGLVGTGYNPSYPLNSIGKPNEPADNMWNGSWSSGRFKTFTINSSSQNSPMFVRNTTTIYNPDLSGSSNPFISSTFEYHNNGSLLYTTGATPTVCTFPLTAIVQNHGNGLLEKIVQNQVPLSGDIVKTRRVQKDQVYRMLKEDPSLMDNSTVLQNFHNTNLTTNNEVFYSIERHLAKNELTQASDELSMVSVQDAVDASYKTFNESALHYQQGVFNAADSTALYQLSNKCPYTDGLVVFQARALYNMALNVVETFNNNCSAISSARLGNTLNENELEAIYNVELFPNPTTNNFVISTLTETAQLKVEILDVQGKLITSEIKDVSNYSATVITNLNNGVYFVNITDISSGSKTVQKLVVQK